MFSQQKLEKLLGSDDYFVVQYFAHGFTGKLQAWIFRSRIEMLLDYVGKIQFKPRMNFDVGCGSMFISRDLIGNRKCQYVGVDILSRDKLKKYRDAMREIGDEAVEAVRANGELLPFRDRTFDFVLSLDMLEHLEKPKQCAIEIGRTVKNRGVIAISLPLENLLQLLRINFLLMKITGGRTVSARGLNLNPPPVTYCDNAAGAI